MSAMIDPKNIKRGALIELRDAETGGWTPLTFISIVHDHVECRTLANEPIFTTTSALIKDARLRPHDGSCRDCGVEAHDGPCIDRICGECGAQVRAGCFQHPLGPVHVYRRIRYLAEVVEDKPYPTRENAAALQKDLLEQMHVLRHADEPRQGRVMIRATERAEILAAIENAVKLIDSLPGARRSR